MRRRARGSVSGVLAILAVACSAAVTAAAAGPVEIRIGHGLANEEQLWLMLARPDLTPSQGKAYTLKFTAFRANVDRLNAYEAGQIDGGTVPAVSAMFAAEQGAPLKLVASICRDVTGGRGFNSSYLALADSGLKSYGP
jgi:ABC-type nitrate/sulfonate/bicarbonate transport system substrate-binding protein